MEIGLFCHTSVCFGRQLVWVPCTVSAHSGIAVAMPLKPVRVLASFGFRSLDFGLGRLVLGVGCLFVGLCFGAWALGLSARSFAIEKGDSNGCLFLQVDLFCHSNGCLLPASRSLLPWKWVSFAYK